MWDKNAKLAYNKQLIDKALNKPKQIWNIIKNSSGTASGQDPYKGKFSLNAPVFNHFFNGSVHDIINDIHKSKKNPVII